MAKKLTVAKIVSLMKDLHDATWYAARGKPNKQDIYSLERTFGQMDIQGYRQAINEAIKNLSKKQKENLQKKVKSEYYVDFAEYAGRIRENLGEPKELKKAKKIQKAPELPITSIPLPPPIKKARKIVQKKMPTRPLPPLLPKKSEAVNPSLGIPVLQLAPKLSRSYNYAPHELPPGSFQNLPSSYFKAPIKTPVLKQRYSLDPNTPLRGMDQVTPTILPYTPKSVKSTKSRLNYTPNSVLGDPEFESSVSPFDPFKMQTPETPQQTSADIEWQEWGEDQIKRIKYNLDQQSFSEWKKNKRIIKETKKEPEQVELQPLNLNEYFKEAPKEITSPTKKFIPNVLAEKKKRPKKKK